MYPKAVEYLQPVHRFAKWCGIFPASITDRTISHLYVIYCMFLLMFPAKSASIFALLYYNQYKDIVVFATELYIISKYAMHLFSISVPLLETKTYSKLFKRLNHAERLIHSLNINQAPSITEYRQYFDIVVTLLIVSGHSAALYTNRKYSLDICFGYFIVYATFFSYIHLIASLLTVVKNKLNLMNWHLDYLSNRVPAYLMPPDDSLFIENKLYGKHTADKFVDANQDTREVSAFKIKRYNQIHFLLWSSCNIISDYFSLQNLSCLLQTSLMVVKYCLFMFEVRHNNLFVFLQTLNSAMTGYSVWLVFVLAKLCNDIICEVNMYETYVNIFKIYIKSF